MKLFINARFLTQPISGVQRYAIECSRQIKIINPDAVFVAPKNIVHQDIADELGAVACGRNSGHLWEQVDLPFFLSGRGGGPLINLANTAPLLYVNNYVTIHDLAFFHHPEWNTKRFAAWYNILVPRIARSAKHIFTVSEAMKSELIKYYKLPTSKITVTYNGLSGAFGTSRGAFPGSKQKIILSVGTFNKRKNQGNLAKAFLASELYKEYKLVFVGDRSKVFSESGIDEGLQANESIEIYERPDNEKLRSIYEQAEIVASLSDYEGFGIPVLEGLSFGCKALCSDIPVYRELFEGLVTFCDQHDINNVSEALATLAHSARSFILDDIHLLLVKYSYERAAQAILSVVNSAVRKK